MSIDLNTAKHVLAGSEIVLSAGFGGKIEILPTKPTKYDACWEIECDNYSGAKSVSFTLDSENVEAAVHNVKTEPLANDAKGYYPLVYRLKISGKLRASRECAIWPDTLEIKAQYKHKGNVPRAKRLVDGEEKEYADGDAVIGFPFKVVQGSTETNIIYTNTEGIGVATLTLAQAATLVPVPPWEIVEPSEKPPEQQPRNRIVNLTASIKSWSWIASPAARAMRQAHGEGAGDGQA